MDIDLSAEPAIAAQATTYFQCWYRDPETPPANFNLADGLEVFFAL